MGKIPWRKIWQPTPVFLPGEIPWTEEPGGLQSMESWKSDTTYQLKTTMFTAVLFTIARHRSPRRQWHPTPVLLPGKSHGRRSLVGCSPWGLEELDTTERLHFHFSLSCIGEGNGNPLQSSCLKNPRDRGAWWAAVYGVAQSRTRLKRLSSSRAQKQPRCPMSINRWMNKEVVVHIYNGILVMTKNECESVVVR